MLKRPIPAHHLLFAAFPALFLFSHNMGQLSPKAVIAPLALSVGAVTAFSFLLNLFIKDGKKTALILSAFLLLFFSYGHVYTATQKILFGAATKMFSVSTELVLLAVWACLFILSACALLRIRRGIGAITTALNAIGAFLIMMSFINIGFYYLSKSGSYIKNSDGSKAGMVERKKNSVTPDIYFIIVDAYASQSILKNLYGYDNSAFLSRLASKGFYVVKNSRSNYCQTLLSLASSLNLDYLDNLLPRDFNIDSSNVEPLKEMILNNRVGNFLKRNGYKTIAFSSWYPTTDMNTADIYIKSGWGIDEFQAMLIDTTPVPVILSAIGLSDKLKSNYRDMILYKFEHLPYIKKNGPPIFVFCHIEAPHPPFVFGQRGQDRKPIKWVNDDEGNWFIEHGWLSKEAYIQYYIDQLIFINHKLEIMLDAILLNSKEKPVIVLQADHGPHSNLFFERSPEMNYGECLSILNACHLPGGGDRALYEGITPVNTFRIIFNHYFGTEYKLLEDKNFFSTARHPYRFIDFTEE